MKIAVAVTLVALMGSCTFVGGLLGLNQVTVDGDSYELSQLALEYMGSNGEGSYDIWVNILSEDYTWGNDVTGNGEWIAMGLTSPQFSLEGGTYTWSSSTKEFGFAGGGVFVGYDTATSEYDQIVMLTGGEVNVRKTLFGDYVFDFEIDGEDWDTGGPVDISGHYRGPIDDEDDLSASVMAPSIQQAAPSLK